MSPITLAQTATPTTTGTSLPLDWAAHYSAAAKWAAGRTDLPWAVTGCVAITGQKGPAKKVAQVVTLGVPGATDTIALAVLHDGRVLGT